MNKQKDILKVFVWIKVIVGLFFLLLSFYFDNAIINFIALIPIAFDFIVLFLLSKAYIKFAAYLETFSVALIIYITDSGFYSANGSYLYYLPFIFGAYLFDAIGKVRIKVIALLSCFVCFFAVNYLKISPHLIQESIGLYFGDLNLFLGNLIIVSIISVFILDYFNKLRLIKDDELKLNQANNLALIENTSDQIWSVDTNFSLITFNSSFSKIHHSFYKVDPLVGNNVLKISENTPLYDFWKSCYERAFKGEVFSIDQQYDFEYETRFFEMSFHPIYKDNLITGTVVNSKDITDRKKQLLAEKLYADNLQLLLNSTQDMIFEMDASGRCARIWHAENMVLYESPDYFLGKNVEQLFDIPFKTNMAPVFDEVARTGVPQRVDYCFNRFDKDIWSTVKFRKIKNSSPPRVSIVLEDITKQKEVEKKEAQQSVFLNKLIDHIPLGLFVKSVKSNLTYTLWNKELELLFNLKQDDVLGKTDDEIFNKAGEIDTYIATDKMVLESKEPLLIEKLNIQVGSEQIIVRTFKLPILDSNGEVESIIGILENITDVVKVQQELEFAEKRWNYALSGSRDAVWDINLTSGESFFSPIFHEMLGFHESDILTTSWEKLLHPDDYQETWSKYLKHVKGETPYFESECRLRKKDGNYIWILNRGKVAESDENGEATRIIGTFSDITYRKKLETQYLEALKKAEEGSRAKSMFLSTMSHEIRTPMNGVIGIINLLIAENPKKEQIESLNALKFSADNLMFLLNDILDFSKIDAGKLIMEESPFDLIKLMQNTLNPFVPIARKKGLNLKLNISQQIPSTLICDTFRLGQVLSNLISNAIKFTHEGNIIVEAILTEKTAKEVSLMFSVEDSGIGIDESYLADIFEQFTQASTDTTRKYGGTGLGLAISKRLVEKMGGSLEVESTKDKGSKFWFTLNLKIADNVLDETVLLEQTEQEMNLEGMRILLVEDNNMNVFVALRFLNKWGINVEVATNGKEAFQMATHKKYHLILMDLQMPEMDGFEASQKIRAQGIQTPIFALSANVLPDVKQKVMESGMNDYISKPFDPNELFLKISKQYKVKKANNQSLDLFNQK